MRVRLKSDPEREAFSNSFNIHGLGEIIVAWLDEDMDSDFISNYEVHLEKTDPPQWKDMQQAFRDSDLISDNYNTRFREPITEEEKTRGWYD